ncbi:hypothetical protein [Corynebacterium aquilae]|nr:hypothetical protein [Corynebacterium aquilae]
MKLTARKSLIAALTAASLTAGVVTAAPAMADESGSFDSFSSSSSKTDKEPETEIKKVPKRDENGKIIIGENGEPEYEYKEVPVDSDKNKAENLTEKLKDWVTLLATIASLFGAIISITKSADNLAKAFGPK